MDRKEKELKKDTREETANNTDELTQENGQTTANHAAANEIAANKDNEASIDNEVSEKEPEVSEGQEEIDPRDALIKELEEKSRELNDKYLRLFSEFDNFRKRMMKEKLELTKTASAEMVEAVLPVLDDLSRAERSATENPDIEILTEGINLIHSKLRTILKQKGLEEIPTQGEIFNTDFHEAITNLPAKNEKEKGKVVDEVQKGYLLNGKVLRFAKVVVAN